VSVSLARIRQTNTFRKYSRVDLRFKEVKNTVTQVMLFLSYAKNVCLEIKSDLALTIMNPYATNSAQTIIKESHVTC